MPRERVLVRIVWRGGAFTETELAVPVHGMRDLSSYDTLVTRLLELEAQGCYDDEIAQILREMTSRTRGRSLTAVIAELKSYLVGWKNYFQLQQRTKQFSELDGWIRHRLRMLQLKHWKNAATAKRELRKLGLTEPEAAKVAGNLRKLVAQLGHDAQQGPATEVVRCPGAAETGDVTSTLRTAGCGPARPVVWEGPGGRATPVRQPLPDNGIFREPITIPRRSDHWMG